MIGGNLGKSLVGLAIYVPLVVVNIAAGAIAGGTENVLNWLERDLPAGPDPDGPVDGDPGADERSEA
jgi:hypothetical protein